VEANLKERDKEAEKAEEIVVDEIRSFTRWLESLDSKPTILSLKEKAEEIRQQELKEAFKKLGNFSEKDRKTIDSLTSALVNKLLHHPITTLKRGKDFGDGEEFIRTVRKLFHLDEK